MNPEVAIAGVPFRVDTGGDVPPMAHRTLPNLRQQIDTSVEAGEASLNREGPWRRTITNWDRGAGQRVQDGPDSIEGRYWSSIGIEVSEEGELSTLPGVDVVFPSGSARADYMCSGPYGVYSIDATTDKIYQFGYNGLEKTVTPSVTGNLRGITTDGRSVWVCTNSGEILRYMAFNIDNGIAPVDIAFGTQSWQGVWWVNGRLIANYNSGGSEHLIDLTADSYATSTPGSLPSNWVSKAVNWGWVKLTDGIGQIYMYRDGDRSIYRAELLADGTALDQPRVAATLPNGESIWSIFGYLGFVVIATRLGFRLGVQNTNGDLTIGERFGPEPTAGNGAPAQGEMTGNGRFVYAGWGNNESIRIDLSRINGTAPAWSRYIGTSGNSANTHVGVAPRAFSITEETRLYFGGPGGVYRSGNDNEAASCSIESGDISYSLPQDKVVKGVTADVVSGSVSVSIVNGDSVTVVGTLTPTVETVELATTERLGTFRIRLELLEPDTVIKSYAVLAYPTNAHTDEITVPLILAEREYHDGDWATSPEPLTETSFSSESLVHRLEFLRSLRDQGDPVTYVEGQKEREVFLTGVDWLARNPTSDGRWFNGTAVVTLKTVSITGVETATLTPSATGDPTFGLWPPGDAPVTPPAPGENGVVDELGNNVVSETGDRLVWS